MAQTAVEKLLELVPVDAKVLELGYGGLEGENTTDAVRARFYDVHGICKDANAVQQYQERTGAKDRVTIGLYPDCIPALDRVATYDLIVHDLGIEGNLAFWSKEGMRKTRMLLRDGGRILVYVMTTDDYGDGFSKMYLKKWREQYWTLDKLSALCESPHFQEERRPEITWVLL